MKNVLYILFVVALPCAMGVGRLTALSDLHVASPWFTNASHHQGLLNLLDNLIANSTKNDTVVFLGDVLELWLTPLNQWPLDSQSTAKLTVSYGFNVTNFVNKVRTLSSKAKVQIMYRGNHDSRLNATDVAKIYGNATIFTATPLDINHIRLVHGHEWDLYNAPDPDSRLKYPLGYYISRLVASYGLTKNSQVSLIQTLLRGEKANLLVKAAGMDEVFRQLVLEMVRTVTGQSDIVLRTPVVGGHWDASNTTILLGDALKMYDNLVGRWLDVTNHNEAEVVAMFRAAALLDYEYFAARKVFTGVDSDVLVAGHTHQPLLATYKRATLDDGYFPMTYVNLGAWVDEVPVMTYLQVDFAYPNVSRPTDLRLMQSGNSTPLFEKWLYSPSVTKVIANTRIVGGTGVSFQGGVAVNCPTCNMNNASEVAQLLVLAMLKKANVVSTSVKNFNWSQGSSIASHIDAGILSYDDNHRLFVYHTSSADALFGDFTLVIKVLTGQSLKDEDTFGESDPFVNVYVDSQMKQTSVKDNTLNPNWQETLQFQINEFDVPLNVDFEVRDDDPVGSEFLGSASIYLVAQDILQLKTPQIRNLNLGSGRGTLRVQLQAVFSSQTTANATDLPTILHLVEWWTHSGASLFKNSPVVIQTGVMANVPDKWLCNPQYYSANDGCDCECGVWDPDCSDLSQNNPETGKVYNCVAAEVKLFCKKEENEPRGSQCVQIE